MRDTIDDHTRDLAETLGVAYEDFIEVFGIGWRVSDTEPMHDFDADPSGGEGYPVTPWMIAGAPPQLMIRVFRGHVFVARPEGTWPGHALVFHPADQVDVDTHRGLEPAAALVREMLAKRRRTFQYCRYCWRHTAPENRVSPGCCHGCGTAVHGIVY